MIVRRKVIDIIHQTGMGAYVLMDDLRQVYILRASNNAACAEMEAVGHWIVGHYCETPDILLVFDDLLEREREIGLTGRQE